MREPLAQFYPNGTRFREVKSNRRWWQFWKPKTRLEPVYLDDPGWSEAPFECKMVWQDTTDAYKELRNP